MVEFLFEVIGYTLLPRGPVRKAVLHLGPTGAGKSILLHLQTALIGEHQVSTESLTAIGSNRFSAANLVGKLANICADIGTQAAEDSSIFKAIVGGDRIVVVGSFIDRKKLIDEDSLDQLTYVAIYDSSTGSYPKLLARHIFEGRFVDGRLLGERAYFVVTSKAYLRDRPTPILVHGEVTANVPVSRTIAFRQPRSRPSFATVHALRLSSPGQVSSKAVLVGNLSVVYMSPTSLYLADTGQLSLPDVASRLLPNLVGPHLTPDDQALIRRIEAVDDDLFSPLEKRDKITNVYCDRLEAMDEQREAELRRRAQVGVSEVLAKTGAVSSTAIHRFDISDLEIALGPTGVVAGQPLNQFAFDEHRGVLRVATTRADDNAVYALDSELEVVGELGELGINERIYAARYLGDRLYLVTFRQIDPFYVIDLSDPTKPKKLGELKIPGVSKYLHPWDANLVLGIGTSQGARRGVKISLFDVTQVSAPRVHAELISEELTVSIPSAYGHRALIVDQRRQLLVVPVTSRDHRGVGALVVKGGVQGFREQGVVWHDSAEWTRLRTQSIEGSLYVQNMLYTKSADIVRASALSDLHEVATAFLR